MTEINWGPTGQVVYERTYSRKKPDGSNETWPETVRRVARGNLELVYGPEVGWDEPVQQEYNDLVHHIETFKILPAGRQLWASGVKGRQFLMNCWTSGWGEKLSDHMEFTFMRLMEGGGVGANYSMDYLIPYGAPRRQLALHIVCDPEHPDYHEMMEAGVLSSTYDSDWDGAFEIEDSREGWAAALVDLIDTFMTDNPVRHANRVYDVSRVRGRGSRLKTFGGTASGPAPLAKMMHDVTGILNRIHLFGGGYVSGLDAMEIDHAIAECVVSGGNRRSARMSIMRWDDPEIFEFIRCKSDGRSHYTTNISIEIDDEFIEALDKTITTTRQQLAQRVHGEATRAMLVNGEPGYFNSSLAQEGEPNEIYCTNPCGEITLEEWEACNLGHVNMDAFAPKVSGEPIDIAALYKAHALVTRFLIRSTFADINDPKSRQVQDRNRRIGVGHLGVQGFVTKQGFRYSEIANEDHALSYGALLDRLYAVVRNTARQYAFDLRIPEPVKVTTVAPTGSIAKMPGVTEGIHPILYRYFIRRIRFSKSDPDQVAQVEEARAQGFTIEDDVYDQSGKTYVVSYPTKELLVEQVEALGYSPDLVETANEIGLDRMLAIQAMYQSRWADNAVSFTVNVPAGRYGTREAMTTIAKHLPKLKGTTINVQTGWDQAPYQEITREQYEQSLGRSVEDSIDMECSTGACPIR